MILPELLREIEDRGVTLFPAGGRLRFRPKCNLPPDLVQGLREHKATILEILERCEASVDYSNPGPIRDVGEVLKMARAYFYLPSEDRVDPPLPEPDRGRDPLVHRNMAKARFFRGIRKRDLEKRERQGLPPWIRLVDSGVNSSLSLDGHGPMKTDDTFEGES